VSHCGHRCCEIADNAYHAHLEPPEVCARCGLMGSSVPLGRIVAEVVSRVAPEIPGLPVSAELAELVARLSLTVYAEAVADPEVLRLAEDDQTTVLAGRVGIALAFPTPGGA
jgi:hypothetical protein